MCLPMGKDKLCLRRNCHKDDVSLSYSRGLSLFKQDNPPPADVHEKYIELMCKCEPHLVYTYLRGSEAPYRIEETLEVRIKTTIVDTN